MRVVVGLGNPGERYRRTRHNAGFMVLDALLSRCAGRWVEEPLCARAETVLAGQDVLLVKPLTFMNRSGEVVAEVVRSRDQAPAELIAVFDDVALPLGVIRVRERGSHGGHNGVRSLIEHLGTDDFARVRIGIRGTEPPTDLAGYVLSDFAPEQVLVVQECIGASADAVEMIIAQGAPAAMSRFNGVRA